MLPDKAIPDNASKAEEEIVLKKEGEEIGHRLVVEGGKTLEFTEENMKRLEAELEDICKKRIAK